MNSNRLTLFIFILVVIFGGSNAVAIRFSNAGLPPFWGAALRFALAGLIFWIVVLARRIPLPTGDRLKGALIYGLFTVGLFYAFLYWGFVDIEASLGTVILTLSPLFTFFFAILHKQEVFRWQGLLGALIALAGIVIGLGSDIGNNIPLLPFLAVVAAAAVAAEGQVLYKQFPPSNPFVVNAIAMTIAPPLLLLFSILFGETRSLPPDLPTWTALAYLIVIGTAVLFYLYLYVLDRWTASATTYSFLLFPISTVFLASWLLNEELSSRFILGGAIVLLGVWLGAFSNPRQAASE